MRFAASALAALVTTFIFETLLPLYWLVGLVAVVAIDREAHRQQLKRCEAGDPPTQLSRMVAWTAFQSAYANGLGAILWFAPLEPGKPLAALFLCGGLANAAATLRRSPSLSLAALSPAALYLIGLPIAEFVLDGARNGLLLAPVIAALLLFGWGAKLWESLLASDRALAAAEASAVRERKAADAANAAKTDMIQRMNDELRTPMQALIGAAEHLRRMPANPELRLHIETLSQAGDVLKLVLEDISDLDRLENNRLRIEAKPADPREIVRSVVSAFRAPAQDKHIELFLDISANVPASVTIDAARARQVLFNLLANAIRFTTHGGVRVRLSAQASERAGHVRLSFSVADTGCGMSRSQLAMVFARPQIGATPAQGAGLGLAISLKLARLMGGRIQARSELEQGSVFSLLLETPVAALAERDVA